MDETIRAAEEKHLSQLKPKLVEETTWSPTRETTAFQ
jgi:hypothetical protein